MLFSLTNETTSNQAYITKRYHSLKTLENAELFKGNNIAQFLHMLQSQPNMMQQECVGMKENSSAI